MLLNTIYGGTVGTVPESEYIRVALVPFAGAVRLNKNAYDYNAGLDRHDRCQSAVETQLQRSTDLAQLYGLEQSEDRQSRVYAWNGCVEARMRGTAAAGTDYNVNDAAPTIFTPATLFPAYFAPDTVGTKLWCTTILARPARRNEYTGLTSCAAERVQPQPAFCISRRIRPNTSTGSFQPKLSANSTVPGPTARKRQLSH